MTHTKNQGASRALEQVLNAACDNKIVPGIAVLAQSVDGSVNYAHTFGKRSVRDTNLPMEMNTVMRFLSATKLVTAVAVMHCVERGLIGLDDDVGQVVKELGDLKVLRGYDDQGKPELVDPKEKITLRRLLSHSSGLAYDVLTPVLMRWRQIHNVVVWPSGPRMEDRFLHPLTSEPGTEWHYSPSLDWAGRVVERLTDVTLDEYVRQYIAKPLGIENDVTFYLQKHPEMSTRRADMTVRIGSGLRHQDESYWDDDPDDCFGGIGLFTTPSAFFAIMQSLLLDDERLLQKSTVEEMFRPQLSEAARQSQVRTISDERYIALMGERFAMGTKGDHALGGILSTEDAEYRKRGTMAWAASTNISWFIDRKAGLCGLYASQLQSPNDPPSTELMRQFERTMYEQLGG